MSIVTTLHNFLYADRKGNIAYIGDGLVPTEPPFEKVDPRMWPGSGTGMALPRWAARRCPSS